jgi:hypothetical protein
MCSRIGDGVGAVARAPEGALIRGRSTGIAPHQSHSASPQPPQLPHLATGSEIKVGSEGEGERERRLMKLSLGVVKMNHACMQVTHPSKCFCSPTNMDNNL